MCRTSKMKRAASILLWLMISVLGAWAYATLTLFRGERLNSAFILLAAICTYLIGYRFYSKWIAARVLTLNDRRATPCEVHDDGKDFVRTNKWIVFGHHFAAISGPGPLVGPVLAAQFGYLPGTLWILIGVVLGGAVQDFVILFASVRRNGKSLGQMVREELNSAAGLLALVSILAILTILLAVLGLVVVKALAESPWGVFTVAATVPIAMFMGGYMRWLRAGKVLEASVIGIVLLLLAVWGGKIIYGDFALPAFIVKTSAFVNSILLPPADAAPSTHSAGLFTIKALPLAWGIIIYGLAASILPVWLLLAPRDYLSTFMKLGTIVALALGIFLTLPDLQMPAVSQFTDGHGPVVAGSIFPFCFITIACGAISGFHTLIASGTTPKIITRESYSRPVAYGGMLLESLVAIMAMIAACTLEPGVYFSMNMKGDPTATVAQVNALGFAVTEAQMQELAQGVGEHSLFGRAGGAATLAVGMANIFSKVTHGRGLDIWYHFAIMFEALFILTTIDAGTRVARYILQDFLGNLWKPLGNTRKLGPNLLASGVMIAGWGYFLIQGVRDPLGGINSLWPLFGIANQMLAAIALCLGTTIILKSQLSRESPQAASLAPAGPKPWLALLTFLPLIWLVSVTFTAGVQKIWHSDPRIGFLSHVLALKDARPRLESVLASATTSADAKTIGEAQKALTANSTQIFNNRLDAIVALAFLILVSGVIALSIFEWFMLLSRRRTPRLRESAPVWLPDHAIREGTTDLRSAAGATAIAFGLLKELSGESALERARQADATCACQPEDSPQSAKSDSERYVEMTEQRFNGVTRCC
jgi:carbon starvation protein